LRFVIGARSLPEVMNDVIDAMPIVRAFRALAPERPRDRLAVALLSLLAIYGALALATPVAPPLQRAIIAAHHFQPRSGIEWFALQPLPKMYGFAHTAWIGPYALFDPARPSALSEGSYQRQRFWVNHYPARRARFDGSRGDTFADPSTRAFIYLRSRYRNTELSTGYQVHSEGGKLVMRRIEGWP
jgi:hypothetical protein